MEILTIAVLLRAVAAHAAPPATPTMQDTGGFNHATPKKTGS